MGQLYSSIVFQNPKSTYDTHLPYLSFVERKAHNYCSHEYVHKIPMVYYHIHSSLPTMIFAHGNACDISEIDVEGFAKKFGVNFIAFDYSGYGLHTQTKKSEYECQEDILAIYDHVINVLRVPDTNIILCGYSLGCSLVCFLAFYLSKRETHLPLILMAPFLSCLKVKFINSDMPMLDMFRNVDLAPFILSNVLLIHGTKDEIVNHEHSLQLSKLFKNVYDCVLLENVNHNDLLYNPVALHAIYQFVMTQRFI